MPEMPAIDMHPKQWQIVRDILQKHVPQYPVWAFGSRAKWNAKPYSDLDLAIITDHPLPLSTLAALADGFSESNLPWRVDIVDWATTSTSFREVIAQDNVVVQAGACGAEDGGQIGSRPSPTTGEGTTAHACALTSAASP